MRHLVTISFFLLLTGCSTFHNGPLQRIKVESEPSGAQVTLDDCGVISSRQAQTPAKVWVSRRAETCRITFSLDQHEPREFTLRRFVTPEMKQNLEAVRTICNDDVNDCDSLGALVGRLFIGGIVAGTGAAVDAASGAMFELVPPRIFVDFVDDRVEPASLIERNQ